MDEEKNESMISPQPSKTIGGLILKAFQKSFMFGSYMSLSSKTRE